MIKRDALERIATACRLGLLSLAEKNSSMFHNFPTGACGAASEVLGRILKEKFQIEGTYICADSHSQLDWDESHAWVEVDEFIIDITHDQFNGTGLSGWVFERGTGWHAQFSEIVESRNSFCTPENWKEYPHDGYRAALEMVLSEVQN
ncbi:hypothetical protein [Pseudomonas sp. 460]|uniref:hypothetical protein n=1 Tax=Pseudomonas sp. 460 TaxID=2485142 RepID=UPI00104ECE9E|nr:hypothetical protein [Pseudomonas sp. 460]TCV51614.1 hypothetical protein EDB99_107280 [Pseudomonas sp. 460]